DTGPNTPPDVDFTDWNGAASGISRNHLVISVGPDGVFVEDEESYNGTLCNGDRLCPRQRYLLNDRDELRLGTMMLRVLFIYPEK
ncbi:MAG: FHA domain-containing protein, partial [Ktedonobacterales bacterium]